MTGDKQLSQNQSLRQTHIPVSQSNDPTVTLNLSYGPANDLQLKHIAVNPQMTKMTHDISVQSEQWFSIQNEDTRTVSMKGSAAASLERSHSPLRLPAESNIS